VGVALENFLEIFKFKVICKNTFECETVAQEKMFDGRKGVSNLGKLPWNTARVT
jgi:hypothetical protein